MIVSLTLLGQMLELARVRDLGGDQGAAGLAPQDRAADRADGSRGGRAARPRARRRPLRVRPGEKVPVDGVVLEGALAASTSRC